ncbi:MAG TPA: Holliday junction resolvase RuvX [Candidatus Enterenecus merdae]|nr:Holliday junction resolvase RuvX [Candidatus Enterenecus merdae]
MRVMAIDYGDARTGVAISDGAGLLAGFTTVLPSREEAGLLEELERLIRERGVNELVLGLPRNMDGTEGARGAVSRAFGDKLAARTGLEVHLWDERRTTIEAHQILHTTGKRMRKHKKTVDAVAATLILEGYLARKRLGR